MDSVTLNERLLRIEKDTEFFVTSLIQRYDCGRYRDSWG